MADFSAQDLSAQFDYTSKRDVEGDDIIELPKPGEIHPNLENLPDNLWLQDEDDETSSPVPAKSVGTSQPPAGKGQTILEDLRNICDHRQLRWECKICGPLWRKSQQKQPVQAPKTTKPTQVRKTTPPAKSAQQKAAAPVKQPRHPDDPLPLEEPEEFWSPEEKEVIESVVGGVAVLGGAGLGLYALLSGLGLIGAKTGAAAAVVGTGVASTAAASATTGAAATGYSAGAGAAEAAALPKAGDARSYLDEYGSRWVEVFDGNNWVDSATNSANQAQIADNQAWQQQEFARQSSGDTAFNRELQQQAEARAMEFTLKQGATRNEIRNINRFLQEMAEGDRKMAEIALKAKEQQLEFLETTKTVIDCVALPLAGATLGPAATLISGAYTVGGEAAAGATEGFINADSFANGFVNAVKGGLKGAAQGAVSVVVSEGLNAAASVGSTVVRTLNSKSPLKVMHNDSSGAELIKKLWGNFKDGKRLTKGLLKTPPQIPPQVKLRYNCINDILIERRAWEISDLKDAIRAERTQDLVWGTASSYKSYFIDGPVTRDVNNAIFAG